MQKFRFLDCSEEECFSIFSCGCNHYKSIHFAFAKLQLFCDMTKKTFPFLFNELNVKDVMMCKTVGTHGRAFLQSRHIFSFLHIIATNRPLMDKYMDIHVKKYWDARPCVPTRYCKKMRRATARLYKSRHIFSHIIATNWPLIDEKQ